MTKLYGECLCGEVTLEFEALENRLSACHCENCRRWTGSAFVEIDAKPGTLRFSGRVKVFESSDWGERAWCDDCGTTLWYHLTVPGHDYYSISAGLVENAGDLPLEYETYIDEKPKGYAFTGDHLKATKAEVEKELVAFLKGAMQ